MELFLKKRNNNDNNFTCKLWVKSRWPDKYRICALALKKEGWVEFGGCDGDCDENEHNND